jgi:site-specific DNA-adenine methylase
MAKKISTFLPLFGTNRNNADRPGKLLDGCDFVIVPFAGGMSEIPHIKARTVVANDLNLHAINLAETIRISCAKFQEEIKKIIFHPKLLARAQKVCWQYENMDRELYTVENYQSEYYDWALCYFICAWMARNGSAGTDSELDTGLSIRWDAGGGDSVVRFRGAAEAMADWNAVFQRCTFLCMDVFDLLRIAGDRKPGMKDVANHGIYCDPPWPKDGDGYRYKFTEAMQRQLAKDLRAYQHARVVVRFGDHPLIREIYPEDHWTWHMVRGRTAANKDKFEVLLTNWKSK